MSQQPIPASPDGRWHYLLVGADTSYPGSDAPKCVAWSGEDPLTAEALGDRMAAAEVAVHTVTILCAPVGGTRHGRVRWAW